MDIKSIENMFEKLCKKLRITPAWTVKLEIIDDSQGRKTGDIKIDCDARKAIVLLNVSGASSDNLEAVLVHELFHLKLYPLDQTTESLIEANYEEDSPGYQFAYRTFMLTLEQTVEELSKCFLLEFGENKEESFGRCARRESFNDLFDGLKSLE